MGSLESTARQLKLDHLALTASATLERRGIPHAVIKGVTTSLWLYDPPREYRDVDLLVPGSRVDEAAAALVADGVVRVEHGRLGEEAAHSLVLVAGFGAELDLHVTLPSLTAEPGSDVLWQLLEPHVEPFLLDRQPLPALDVVGRCLVLALHVVASGQDSAQVREDFRRARAAVSPQQWQAALDLADRLGVSGHVAGAQSLVDGGSLAPLPAEVALRLSGGSATAIQLARLAGLPLRRLPRELWSEALPSRQFIERLYPEVAQGRLTVAAARRRRLLAVLRSVPKGLREVSAVRRREAEQ